MFAFNGKWGFIKYRSMHAKIFRSERSKEKMLIIAECASRSVGKGSLPMSRGDRRVGGTINRFRLENVLYIT